MTPSEFAFSIIAERQGRTLQFVANAHNGQHLFTLKGTVYRPDFFDPISGHYVEVCGTRQAYHANKRKYAMFRELHPDIPLEIVKPDGSPVVFRN